MKKAVYWTATAFAALGATAFGIEEYMAGAGLVAFSLILYVALGIDWVAEN